MQNSSRNSAFSLVVIPRVAISSDSRRGDIDDYRRLCTLLRAPANVSILKRGGTADENQFDLFPLTRAGTADLTCYPFSNSSDTNHYGHSKFFY